MFLTRQKTYLFKVIAVATTPFVFYNNVYSFNSPNKNESSCANPVCSDQLKAFRMATDSVKGKSSGDEASKQLTLNEPIAPVDTSDCPLDRKELGEKTWSLLHTIAAYYPENPSQEYQLAATQFIQALALLYPCKHCAEDFQQSIELSPPDVSSHTAFALWLCEQHNNVNEKLEKEKFPCSIEKLNERWKTGKVSCWVTKKVSIGDENIEEEGDG